MTSRNQNKPPVPRSPVNKKRAVTDDAPNKRSKIGTGRMMASTTELAPVNTPKEAGVTPAETDVSECQNIEFTKEAVDALLNESLLHSTGKQDWMPEYLKKLKVCIKWFQKALEDLVAEKENLSKMLELSEQKRVEAEAAMKSKKEEFKAIISKLKTMVSTCKESLTKEESAKLESEKERCLLVETLRSKLEDTRQKLAASENKVRQLESQLSQEQRISSIAGYKSLSMKQAD